MMPTIQTEPKLPVVVAFEKWWLEQRDALEMSPAMKFAAWNGWLACSQTPRPEAAALTLLDEAIQELGKHYAPKDVIATKEGMDGWNGAVGYCIGTLLRMQDDRRGPQERDAK